MKPWLLAPYRALWLLSAGCVLNGCLVAWEWQVIQQVEPLPNDSLRTSQYALGQPDFTVNAAELLPLQNYQAMIEAPLFFQGRQETPLAVAETDDTPLKLTGVVLTPQGFAALVRDEQGVYYKLDQGQNVQGWTVAAVEKDRVQLVRNAESRELTLFEGSQPDLTAQDLENCFKGQADLPLQACFKQPEKFADKRRQVTA